MLQTIGSAIGQGPQLVQPLVDGTLQTANATAQNAISGLQPDSNGSASSDQVHAYVGAGGGTAQHPRGAAALRTQLHRPRRHHRHQPPPPSPPLVAQNPVLSGIQAGVASLTSALNNGLNAAGQIQGSDGSDIVGSISSALGAALNTTRNVLGAAANASTGVAANITNGLTAAAQAVNASLGSATAAANQALSPNATAAAQGPLGIVSALVNTAGSILNDTAALGQQQQQPAAVVSDPAAGTGSGAGPITLPGVTSQSGPDSSDGLASSLAASQAPAGSPVVLTVGASRLQSGASSLAWTSVPMALAGVAALVLAL